MAIFKCVGYFYFHVPEGICFRKETSEADSFRHMEIKISYTLEDGHVGRNVWGGTVTADTVELHTDGNMARKTH
jgi:hypothetical protein